MMHIQTRKGTKVKREPLGLSPEIEGWCISLQAKHDCEIHWVQGTNLRNGVRFRFCENRRERQPLCRTLRENQGMYSSQLLQKVPKRTIFCCVAAKKSTLLADYVRPHKCQ